MVNDMKNFAVLMMLFALSACASKGIDGPVVIPNEPTVIHPQLPRSININKIEFDVLDAAALKMLIEKNPQAKLIVIDTKNYQTLIMNIADIKRYIEQQQAVIDYYRNLFNESK